MEHWEKAAAAIFDGDVLLPAEEEAYYFNSDFRRKVDEEIERLRKSGITPKCREKFMIENNNTIEKHQTAFISHDSRDKEIIARPLAEALSSDGYRVWFDEYSLNPGDRLRESIEKGIKECSKCILVLTNNFLTNEGWGKTEFNSIFTREIFERKKLFIPIWYNITKEQVFEYSPSLSDIVAVIWDRENPANSIKRVINSLEK